VLWLRYGVHLRARLCFHRDHFAIAREFREKRSLWRTVASRVRNRFSSTILQRASERRGEDNSLQDRSEAKVEHKYHNTESLRCTDEVLRFGIRK
jgi:hypothetical protein